MAVLDGIDVGATYRAPAPCMRYSVVNVVRWHDGPFLAMCDAAADFATGVGAGVGVDANATSRAIRLLLSRAVPFAYALRHHGAGRLNDTDAPLRLRVTPGRLCALAAGDVVPAYEAVLQACNDVYAGNVSARADVTQDPGDRRIDVVLPLVLSRDGRRQMLRTLAVIVPTDPLRLFGRAAWAWMHGVVGHETRAYKCPCPACSVERGDVYVCCSCALTMPWAAT